MRLFGLRRIKKYVSSCGGSGYVKTSRTIQQAHSNYNKRKRQEEEKNQSEKNSRRSGTSEKGVAVRRQSLRRTTLDKKDREILSWTPSQ